MANSEAIHVAIFFVVFNGRDVNTLSILVGVSFELGSELVNVLFKSATVLKSLQDWTKVKRLALDQASKRVDGTYVLVVKPHMFELRIRWLVQGIGLLYQGKH
jgi:hypothetical protein